MGRTWGEVLAVEAGVALTGEILGVVMARRQLLNFAALAEGRAGERDGGALRAGGG
ncbi:MAG TPA: hypothetical protein VFN48_03245 [Solirubrobacteraceae bacterium]|nr:hypothetical protein [Solirubrobacteraceae bacterium]